LLADQESRTAPSSASRSRMPTTSSDLKPTIIEMSSTDDEPSMRESTKPSFVLSGSAYTLMPETKLGTRGAMGYRMPYKKKGSALIRWGDAYASPTALFVLVLFVVPLALVFRMSASRWPLLSGDQGINFPDNFTAAVDNRFFVDSVVFTLKYTVLATILLIALGLGLALMVQESSRWKGLLRTSFLVPSALGLASASLLFYVLYSPLAGPLAPFMERMGWSFLGSPDAALASTLFLIVWRYAGF